MAPFQFKQFIINQDKGFFKITTDSVLLAAWASVDNKKHGLDIGTGTGVIALGCTQRNSDLMMDAVEVNEASANEATANVNASKFSNRIKVHHSDIQSFALGKKHKYDFIVSNPPFFKVENGVSSSNKKQSTRQTNLLNFEELLDSAICLMDASASFDVILPYQEGLEFIELAKTKSLCAQKITSVKGRLEKPIERLLISFSRSESELEQDELIIQRSGVRHDYTNQYIALVKDFYTIL